MEKITLSRRHFVSIAAAAAGSAFLAGCSNSPTVSGDTTDDSSDDTVEAKATVDFIVVGAGGAGLMAAARAGLAGAKTIVLESQSMIGGTTSLSGGNYKAITDELLAAMPERTEKTDAALQTFMEYDPADFGDYADDLRTLQSQIPTFLASDSTVMFDSIEKWTVEHFIGTQGVDKSGVAATTNYKACAAAYRNQGMIYEWLKSIGIEFSNPRDNDPTGGPVSISPNGGGGTYTNTLAATAEATGNVEIITDAPVSELYVEDGRVAGVKVTTRKGSDLYLATKGVMLATGGFGSSSEKVVANDNRYDGIEGEMLSMEATGAVGEGIDMAVAAGAATTNMGFIQYFPNLATGIISLGSVFGFAGKTGKFIVNKECDRFVNDQGGMLRNNVDSLNQTEAKYFLIGDAANVEKLGDQYEQFTKTGAIVTGETIEEAAAAAGLDGAALAATVAKFNGYCDDGTDPDFGRTLSAENKVETAPFIIGQMCQAAQNTMGGLVVDEQARVLDASGNVIEGLYAAGEVTGIFDGAARRHGDNYAHIFYYGWLIGEAMGA